MKTEKSQIERETSEPIEEIKYPQENNTDSPIVFNLDHINGNGMNDLRVQAMFKLSRHSNMSGFIVSQDYYELPISITGASGSVYIIFSKRAFSEMNKIYIKTKQVWIRHLMKLNY